MWSLGGLVGRYLRLSIHGEGNLPPSGAYIVASNHRSYLDPIVIACGIPRVVHFMAKAELFSPKPLGLVFASLGAIPVRRGKGDRRAIASCEGALAGGQVVGIFPEGTIPREGERLRARRGVARLALAASVPVVPVAIAGSDRAMPRGSWAPRRTGVRLIVGRAIRPPTEGEDLQAYADRVMEEVERLASRASDQKDPDGSLTCRSPFASEA